jgi:hypothetical protein
MNTYTQTENDVSFDVRLLGKKDYTMTLELFHFSENVALSIRNVYCKKYTFYDDISVGTKTTMSAEWFAPIPGWSFTMVKTADRGFYVVYSQEDMQGTTYGTFNAMPK